jgi:hypothetical protein
MAALKCRYQNPTAGDTVKLEFFVYNSNMTAEVAVINEIRIYYINPALVTHINPQGRVLVQTIPGSAVQNPNQGEYLINLYLDPAIYTETGRYIDEWDVIFQPGDPPANHDQLFQIFSELWYTTPIPVVYDFSFYFQPNKMRMGEVKPIEIEIIPNVPRATDLCTYYENLAIASQLFVYIRQRCGDCIPCESDLQLLVDRQPVFYKEKNRGYYKIDTTQFDCGIYDIWFELDFGTNVYISDTNQLQIYS